MKVTQNNIKKEPALPTTPCLMISNESGNIVYVTKFHDPELDRTFEGFVISSKNSVTNGSFSTTWSLAFFEPFEGTITLEND